MTRGAALAAAALALALLGCGGAGGGELVVSAAASLSAPLTACTEGGGEPRIRLQFGGSDELAAQIRQGVEPDVYAAANTDLPRQLADEGLLERPVTFATNELVIATREGAEVEDLGAPGVVVVVGSDSVPIGAYTRELLDRMPPERAAAIRANVRSEEPDVKGIVGKLTQGAADAGFVYRTDVRAAEGLEARALAPELRPRVAYAAGIVRGTDRAEEASAFVEDLRSGGCADALRAAGFGAP